MATSWDIKASKASLSSINIIREIAATIEVPAGHPLEKLNLTFGDPSVYSDFPPPIEAVRIVTETLESGTGNGYIPTLGPLDVRQALADYYSNSFVRLTPDDVAIDFGGIGAIGHVLKTLCNPGDNFVFPSPGYSFYSAIANTTFEARNYRLLPERSWEVDLQHLEAQIDERTRVIVIINPSNPCGSVYSREHLIEILEIARRHHIPVLADEVYERMTYSKPFVSCAELCQNVPVIVVGSISKRWLIPGWRVGWTLLFDRMGVMDDFRLGLARLKNGLIHPTTFIIKSIPRILAEVPDAFFEETNAKLKINAEHAYRLVNSIPGLSMAMPEGAMYAVPMIDFKTLRDISDSIDFCVKLSQEQAIQVLPLDAFFGTGGFRIVLCNSVQVLDEFASRLRDFMASHSA